MNSVWYKFRSATTWRELQIPSTFLTIGEMRQLICKELHLQEQETVLLSENGDDNYRPLADEKQFPRGSRFWARRTTLDHLRREKEVLEQAQRSTETQETENRGNEAHDDSDDDFGPDLFDRDAQMKYEERERRTHLEAVADQIKEEQKLENKEAIRHKDGAKVSVSLDEQAVKLDPKRVSVRLVDEADDMDIDWASLIEQRKTSKAGEVKQEPADALPDDKSTVIAASSQAVTAAPPPGELLEAPDTDTQDPNPAPEPAVPSLLETYPQLLNICSHILPHAPLKQLYLAFPNTRPRTRADWEAFQKTQREVDVTRQTEVSGRAQPASPPGTPPRSRRPPSRARDISPGVNSPRQTRRRWSPASRSQSPTPARSPYPASRSPSRRHRTSAHRSSSPGSDSREQSPPYDRFRSRSPSAPPRRHSRDRSLPAQDLRYSSDLPAASHAQHHSPYAGGPSRGGLRGRAPGGSENSGKDGTRTNYDPPKDLRRWPPNRETSYTPPPERRRVAETSSPGHTAPRSRKHANASGGFARRALGGIMR